MKLIKSAVRRSKLSEVLYVALNVALVVLVLVLAVVFQPPYLAYALVVLSKWRVFAVRPRFWMANIQTNTVDLMVGLSVVTLIWLSSASFEVQLVLAALYAAWLLVVKPRSKRKWVLMQAGVSQFVTLITLFSFAYELPVAFVVLAAWLVGYLAARHALAAYEEDEVTLFSLAWGFMVAELAWLVYHWTIAYTLIGDLKVPQIAIVVAGLGYVAIKMYSQLYHSERGLKWSGIRWPVLFVVAIIVMLLAKFSGLDLTEL